MNPFMMFKGKLTYGLSALAIAYGIFGFLGGYISESQALEIIWMGLAVFGIRRAI